MVSGAVEGCVGCRPWFLASASKKELPHLNIPGLVSVELGSELCGEFHGEFRVNFMVNFRVNIGVNFMVNFGVNVRVNFV